jgi:hypothetical protein
VIFGILGLDLALGAGPDCWTVRMMRAEGAAVMVLRSIGTRAAAICSLPLPEKFLLSQKNLRDGEDLAGSDETTAARRAIAMTLEHKGKRGHMLMPAGPKGEKRQKATVVDASIFCAIATN